MRVEIIEHGVLHVTSILFLYTTSQFYILRYKSITAEVSLIMY